MQTYLYIDASEFNDLAEEMRKRLTPQNFDKLMRRTLNEVGKRSKKPIREAITQEYHAKKDWINKSIKSAKVSGGGGNIICRIPLASEKGTIGGMFGAQGGWYGWGPDPYEITADIVKGSKSKLPSHMTHQGGQPPFRNIGERKKSIKNPNKMLKKPKVEVTTGTGRIVFTRKGKSRYPIEPVSGIAVPQMPLNRSRAETEDKILEVAEKRLIHNFSRIFD